ncbi:MAG: hypothetical protein DRG82_16855, partial [Deltaproteobacteria bacterium]
MDESFRDVLQHFVLPRPDSQEIMKVILILLLLVLLLFAVSYLRSYIIKLRERSSLLKSARRRRLSPEEIELVLTAAESNPKTDPKQIFNSVRDFHRLFDPWMHELSAKAENDPQARRKLDGIFALRKKLFGEVAYHFGKLTSTIQLRSGQKLQLQFSYEGQNMSAPSVVLDVDAAAITVANPCLKGEFLRFNKGDLFKVSFFRDNDGYYQFETHALRSSDSSRPHFLFLAHAEKIQRIQSREFYRLNTRIPFKFRRFAWNDDLENRYLPGMEKLEMEMEGVILDISG